MDSIELEIRCKNGHVLKHRMSHITDLGKLVNRLVTRDREFTALTSYKENPRGFWMRLYRRAKARHDALYRPNL